MTEDSAHIGISLTHPPALSDRNNKFRWSLSHTISFVRTPLKLSFHSSHSTAVSGRFISKYNKVRSKPVVEKLALYKFISP